MAGLKIIEYAGPAKLRIRKPSSNNSSNRQFSCPDSDLQMNVGKTFFEAPPAGGGTGDRSWYRKTAEDKENAPRVSSDYLIRDQRKCEMNLSDCFIQSNEVRLI